MYESHLSASYRRGASGDLHHDIADERQHDHFGDHVFARKHIQQYDYGKSLHRHTHNYHDVRAGT
jgi:hypothetical protein